MCLKERQFFRENTCPKTARRVISGWRAENPSPEAKAKAKLGFLVFPLAVPSVSTEELLSRGKYGGITIAKDRTSSSHCPLLAGTPR